MLCTEDQQSNDVAGSRGSLGYTNAAIRELHISNQATLSATHGMHASHERTIAKEEASARLAIGQEGLVCGARHLNCLELQR